jgi:hypothetical protein
MLIMLIHGLLYILERTGISRTVMGMVLETPVITAQT